MMKKRTFSLIALAAMLLASTSFVGCSQKDYGADIEGLQKQITDNKTAITALQQAMGKGQMIAKIETTPTGYKLTMSDNTTLLLTNGKEAAAPQMRVNAAKNWELSVDGGTTWSEVKDAQGNPIAEAKIFVKDYVKINSDGYLVIGDQTTSFQYDVTIPSVTIMAEQLMVLITVPNDNGGFDTAYVPMEGYFDKWSVAEIKPMTGKLTFTVTKTELDDNATIDGVDYASGDVVYSSVGVPVVLNPSMIDATQIPFGFVASLTDNTPYELPMELVATPGTGGAISTITKASSPTAVWTINLKDAAAYRLKGNATNVALFAQNANGTQTLSDYVFDITEDTGSSVASTDNVVNAFGYKDEGVVVAPATNIIASTLYATAAEDAAKVRVLREDGSIVDGAAGKYESYTGKYYVELIPTSSKAGGAENDNVVINLTYACIGADGGLVSVTPKATFQEDTEVQQSFTIEAPIAATFADLAPTEVKITQANFLAAVFGDNSIAQADFEANGIKFGVANDAEAKKHGIKVEYFKSNSKVEAPANVAAWDEIRVTAEPKAFFAIAPTEYAPKLTFQIDGLTPPTSTQGVNLLFTMAEAESHVLSAKSIFIDDLYADETTLTLALTDVSVYSDAEAKKTISVAGAVAEFISVADETGKISATIETDGSVVLTRIGDAPEAPEDVELTIVVLDAWGQEHSFTHKVTLSEQNKPGA